MEWILVSYFFWKPKYFMCVNIFWGNMSKHYYPPQQLENFFSQIAFWCFFACSWEMETWREWKFCNKSEISEKKSEWNIAFDIKMMPLVIFQHSFVKMALLPSRIFFLELIPRDTLLRTIQNTTITKNYFMKWSKFYMQSLLGIKSVVKGIEFEIIL